MAKNKVKKKWYQKLTFVWWIWAVILVIIIITSFGSNNDDVDEPDDNNEIVNTDTQISNESENEEDISEEEPFSFELIAGEQGEYGELITVNKDTEFEEVIYIYHIPAGTYKVTNIGEYMNQFNVYSNEYVVNEDGWEEIAEAYYIKVLNPGESDTFTIEEGQHVDICEPGKFLLEKIA